MPEPKTEKKAVTTDKKQAPPVAMPQFQLSMPVAIIVAGLIIGLAIVYSNTGFKTTPGGGTGGGTAFPTQTPGGTPPNTPPPDSGEPVDVSVDDDPVIGDASAPVTIIEFSDFQCPFCKSFFDNTLPQIEQNYINTGKVKLVYRDFPLPSHENAQKAAEAAQCAHEQGKWREMHDSIFENQSAIAAPDLKGYAGTLGLDTTQFNNCLDSGKYEDEVQKDMTEGTAAGVSGTPTFFINGRKIVGAQSYSSFASLIEAELNK